MAYTFAGRGYKRTQLNLSLQRLILNPNPVRHENTDFQSNDEAVRFYLEQGDLQPLIASLATHGYFDEEPIVAVPESLPKSVLELPEEELMWSEEYVLHIHNPNNSFVVIEGNRRVAATLAIMSGSDKYPGYGIPEVPEHIMFDLSIIPSIIYTTEKEVLPYLYIRHGDYMKHWEDKECRNFQSKMQSFGHSGEYISLFKG